MKCKFCSYSTSYKTNLISHIKTNHRREITKLNVSNSYDEDYFINDSLFETMIYESFSDFTDNSSFSGGGGDFGGGGSSSSWDSGSSYSDSCSCDSGSSSCGD